MKALVVSTEFPPGPGGIGTHAFELVRHLAAAGWTVRVLAAQDHAPPGEVDEFNAGLAFPVESWGRTAGVARAGRAVSKMRELLRACDETKPDIVIASGRRAVLLASVLGGLKRVSWIAVVHGSEFGRRTGGMALALRRALKGAEAVVCVSEYTRGLMREHGSRHPRVVVIPNGADSDRFRELPAEEVERVRGQLGVPGGRWILTVGNVTPRKGQEVVVRALPRIVREVPDARYLLAGLPSEAGTIETLAKDLGVADRVHVLGRVRADALPGLLNAADLFVLTSRRTAEGDVEGYGIAVVEAALCGTPAVVSAGSGLAEAVAPGRTALVVPENDPDATGAAVSELLRDESRRREMGRRARRRALDEQSWASRIREYDRLLRELAAARAPARREVTPA